MPASLAGPEPERPGVAGGEGPGRPLSARQSLLWLDEQLHPEARWHELVLTVELRGALDPARLERAFAETALGRDAFWCEIDPKAGLQAFAPARAPELPRVTLTRDELPAWLAGRAVRPRGPRELRWDAALLRLGPGEHVFVLRHHQIAADPASLLAVVEELAARYGCLAPPPAPGFQGYLDEEAAYRSSPQVGPDQAYWSGVLSGGAPPLRPYGLARTDRSAAVDRTWLEGAEARTRAALARSQEAPFRAEGLPGEGRLVLLATALAALVARVTGNREVLLGIPIAIRTPARARSPGLLLEQLFLRVELEEGDRFLDLAERVRRGLEAGAAHGRACVSDRGLEYPTLELLPPRPTRFADLDARVTLAPATALGGAGAGRGDRRGTLGVVAHDFAEGPLELAFDLHRATFGAASRRRVLTHFARLLDAMLADPGAAVAAVDLVDEEERRTLLEASAGAEARPEAPDLLVRLAAQVRRRPEAVAVEAHDGVLTYAALDARSNQLARRLQGLGVGREARVGVAIPRGAAELTALLATLKAGGAYVPVDPTHPVERVRVILEDAAPEVLVAPAGSPLVAALPPGARLLPLDDLAAATAGLDASPLDAAWPGDQLAYVLFTSGSTGRPKGVEVLRGAFANFLRSMAHTPGLAEHDRVLAVTTTTFDIAGLELFLPLWVGATTVVVDRETAADPRRLRVRLEGGAITVLQATPATWRLLVEAGWRGDGRLRMLCGGEALSPELAARLLERGGELWNVYGPTETTVWSTLDRVARAGDRITIGRPIDRTQVHVLDPALQLVPVGVVGEIFIGGDGLARGYHGRPDLTAERFLPSPFGAAGARLYRTGDLGRVLEDGRLECLGRVDHQVKVRGFRIELGEIESALRTAPGVREAVVVADGRGGGDPRLVAYWVGEADRAALLEQARRRLPPYMVPAAWRRLDAFPLTTSGKVDRKALPPPEPEAAAAAGARRPRTDLEVRVAAVWRDLLGVGAVGVDEDFFALGGSSVLAIQARARIEAELGVELPLRAFFEHPTVEGLVGQLGRPAVDDAPIAVRLRPGRPGAAPLFCLAGVQLYQDVALALEGDRPVIGIHIPIRYDRRRERCPGVPEIARRYVEAIRAHQPAGPYLLAGLCFGGIVAFEAARQLELEGESVPVVAVFDGQLPGAVRVDRLGRLRGRLGRALRDPRAAAASLGGKARQLASRLVDGVARRAPGGLDGERADLAIDGPEADALAHRYGRAAGRIRGRLLVFRAVARGWPAWIELAPDLGWGRHAAEVVPRDVACDHLDIVRGAHARALAGSLDEAFREAGVAATEGP